MTEEEREAEFSLLRPELDEEDLVTHGDKDCEAQLHMVGNVTHYCTRPGGHVGQHYSFNGGGIGTEPYEVIWPIVPPDTAP